MIKQATNEQINFVREYLRPGWIKTKEDFAGDDLKRFQGIMGQVIIGDFLGIKRPTREVDGGFDIVWKDKKWDVKTEIRTVKFLKTKFVHNLNGKQIKNDCDGYLFLSYNQTDGSFEICGYIEKNKFLEKAKFFKPGETRERTDGSLMPIQGSYGMYEIENKYLEEFNGQDS